MPPKPTPQRHRDKASGITLAQVQAAFNEAVALHQAGKLDEAQATYDNVLRVQPRHAQCLHVMGILQAQRRNHAEAVERFGQALAVQPQFPEALVNLGVALRNLGRLQDAVASYDKAIALRPNSATAHFNRGNALAELGRHGEAVTSYDRAIAVEPKNAEALFNRGKSLRALDHLDEALASFDAAVAAQPRYAQAHAMAGNVLLQLERADDAVARYRQALAIDPALAGAWSNLGVAHARLKRWADAAAAHEKALSFAPGDAEAHTNLGNLLMNTKRLDDAIARYDHSLRLRPGHPDTLWSKSFALLLKGDLAKGFELFESRWVNDKTGLKRKETGTPLWLGKEPLAGRSILLHAEQGLGDTIQFCRYIPLVEALGARVVAQVPRPLLGLLSTLRCNAQWIARGEPEPPCDFHAPFMSLPLAFGTDRATVPNPGAYLHAQPEKVARWAERLGTRTRPRVGLAWSGNAAYQADRDRSLALATLAQFLPLSCDYYSLQNEVRPADEPALAAHPHIRHFGHDTDDFTEAAALCELMDVVVSVDTSLGHLAGALGKRTWLLLAYTPDWRWMLERTDSPWYSSVRLMRQDADATWPTLLVKVQAALEALARAG